MFFKGILGSVNSGKSALVHRFLTGTYVREESPEGGRFKKEMAVDGQSHLLLVRDEGGPPEEEVNKKILNLACYCLNFLAVYKRVNQTVFRQMPYF